jgi:hypothetical protein
MYFSVFRMGTGRFVGLACGATKMTMGKSLHFSKDEGFNDYKNHGVGSHRSVMGTPKIADL